MRSLLLASLVFASSAAAQTAANHFLIYNEVCTNFTSRGSLGMFGGNNLIQVPGDRFSGIGHDASGGGTKLLGFRSILQDQNAATVEAYSYIIRADSGGAPDPNAGGILFQTAAINSPGGSGILAWNVFTDLGTPATTALPTTPGTTFYYGMDWGPSGWTADGLSTHINTYYPLAGNTCGLTRTDNPAPTGVPNLTWNLITGAASATQPGVFRSPRYELKLEAAVLNLGNVDTNLATDPTWTCFCGATTRSFGCGGMYPQNGGSRVDGMDFRVRNFNYPMGLYALFLGEPGAAFNLAPIFAGNLYLNLAGPNIPFTQLSSGSLDAAGQGIGTIVPPNFFPPSFRNFRLDFQAFTLGAGFPGMMTNSAATSWLP